MATFRSSFSLLRMVEAARELTTAVDVLKDISAVEHIMGGYRDRLYGKGRPLVDALEEVARTAILHGDFDLAQRFQRFAAYARGDLFLEVLELHYDERARQRSEEYIRRYIAEGVDRAVTILEMLCQDNPEATAADARDLFRGLSKSVDQLGVEAGENGVRLSTLDLRRLQRFGHMEIFLRSLPQLSAEDLRLAEEVLADADAELLTRMLEFKARKAALDTLGAAVDDPDSSEGALHACLKKQEWIFGGAFVAELARRQYTPDTILDIPLLRADGSLHVVELKRANIESLVVRRSGHLMLGAPAHRAVSQAMNYLRTLDESRPEILAKYGVDARRASATVVVGHSQYVGGGITPSEVAETIRTFNSHNSRIEVITYETLLESAARMLALSSPQEETES
ncbi:Shedu anti-phage system protein SduA domain-containing protein [Kitasatospora sp. NPDC092948]|uniref:Shedu anti-phage system protein SduA domain-containing protein n=1 Tax=Kitasatospora sp. NPDC092948 TaxID=3364088 RepID=UPI003825F18B